MARRIATDGAYDPAPHALHRVMRILEVTDAELGERVGVTHQRIQQKRTGARPIRTFELAAFAHALGVPVEILTANDARIFRYFADWYAARDSNPEPTDSDGVYQLCLEDGLGGVSPLCVVA